MRVRPQYSLIISAVGALALLGPGGSAYFMFTVTLLTVSIEFSLVESFPLFHLSLSRWGMVSETMRVSR